MASPVKHTPLHDCHRRLGATMGGFAGYEMPIWYPAGVKQEHLAVINRAGIFDTSHMAVVTVAGHGAFELLQHCFSRDLSHPPLASGRSVYGVFLDADGGVIDDAIVYRLDDEAFMVVVNAGNGAAIAAHLHAHRRTKPVDIADLTDRVGKLDVQGPKAGKVVQRLIEEPAVLLARFPYFSFKGQFQGNGDSTVRTIDGAALLLSRSGYTGEFGFELFVQPEAIGTLWERALAVVKEMDGLPCGLAARDSLRVGAVLPLSHQDIGPWPFTNTPWPFALPYAPGNDGFTKDFIGAEAVRSPSVADYTYPFAGFDLRKVVADEASVRDDDGNTIGSVLTCVTDMAIGRHQERIVGLSSPDRPDGFVPKGLSCGFIKVNCPLEFGTVVELVDRRRTIRVMVVADIRPHRTARRPIHEML